MFLSNPEDDDDDDDDAHLSTGASREAPVDNASFLLILGMSTPGISGLGTQAYRGGSHRGLSSQAQALTPVIQDQQKTKLFGVHAQVSYICTQACVCMSDKVIYKIS